MSALRRIHTAIDGDSQNSDNAIAALKEEAKGLSGPAREKALEKIEAMKREVKQEKAKLQKTEVEQIVGQEGREAAPTNSIGSIPTEAVETLEKT